MSLLSIAAAARSHPDALAVATADESVSYAELYVRAARLGDWLDTRAFGFGSGAGIEQSLLIRARRTIDDVALVYAAIERGIPLALVHARSTAAEMALAVSLLPHRECVLDATALARELADAARGAPLGARGAPTDEPPSSRALAVLLTSGTTGVPRAAILSRRAFVAAAEASATNLPLDARDRWLVSMPLSHVGGLSILIRALRARAAVVLAPEASFDARAISTLMTSRDVTLASFVPTMLSWLLELGELPLPPRLRAILLGGARAPSELLARAADTNLPVLTTYGLTEACAQVATQRRGTANRGELGVGPPLPGIEVRVEDGEIQVRGATLFDGYVGHRLSDTSATRAPESTLTNPAPGDWRRPSAFSATLCADGWFRTGDLGHIDDMGNLHVGARRDDRIVTGGENVDPAEVEDVLLAHPSVRAACVVGVPDEVWGELIVAVVERHLSSDVANERALIAFVSDRLAVHKRPRRWVWVESLPLGSSGKVSRRLARETALPVPG